MNLQGLPIQWEPSRPPKLPYRIQNLAKIQEFKIWEFNTVPAKCTLNSSIYDISGVFDDSEFLGTFQDALALHSMVVLSRDTVVKISQIREMANMVKMIDFKNFRMPGEKCRTMIEMMDFRIFRIGGCPIGDVEHLSKQ